MKAAKGFSVDSQWHLDKKVPIALIVTVCIQTATIVWWARGMQDQVAHLSQQSQNWSAKFNTLQARMYSQESKNSRIEAQLLNIDRTQQQILQKVDALYTSEFKK